MAKTSLPATRSAIAPVAAPAASPARTHGRDIAPMAQGPF